MPAAMDQTHAQLLATPDAYLHALEGGEAVLVPMDRAAYRRSIFLDHRISPAGEGGWRVPVAALAGAAPPAQPLGWIFHVAHCGSTLLARALDELGGALVLREPLALRQLALQPDPSLLPAVLALLSRRYPGDGPSLVKANVPVNFMLDRIVAAQPEARAVFLWSTLEDYLLAILRSDNHRAWLRGVTDQLGIALGEPLPTDDAERAALLWIAQLRRFVAALETWPQARSLEAEVFFARPGATLQAAARVFDQPAEARKVETLTTGPLFNTYSKNPQHGFDNAARVARREAVAAEITAEIAQAQGWIAVNAPDADAVVAKLRSTLLQDNGKPGATS